VVDQLINLLIKYHLHLSSQSKNHSQLSQNEKYEEWKNIISSSSHLPPSDLSILLKTKEFFFENYHLENHHHEQNNEIKDERDDGWLRCGNLQNIFDFLEKEKDKEEKEDHDYLKFLVSDISPIELLKFHLFQYSSSFENKNNQNDQNQPPSHLSQNNNQPTSQFEKGEGYTCGLWKLFHILLLSLSHPTSSSSSSSFSSSFSSQDSYLNNNQQMINQPSQNEIQKDQKDQEEEEMMMEILKRRNQFEIKEMKISHNYLSPDYAVDQIGF